MEKQVTTYQVSFAPDNDYGVVRLYFDDGEFHDLEELSSSKVSAVLALLSKEPIFWNGIWLYTSDEVVQE